MSSDGRRRSVKKAKEWSDAHREDIVRLVGKHLGLTGSPVWELAKGGDLSTLVVGPMRVLVTMRSAHHFDVFPGDITVRYDRPTGRPTALQKIVGGWGDFFFYGFSHPVVPLVAAGSIGDLSVFRSWYAWLGDAGTRRYLKRNHDESSAFYAIPLRHLPPDFVVAHWGMPPVVMPDKFGAEASGQAHLPF